MFSDAEANTTMATAFCNGQGGVKGRSQWLWGVWSLTMERCWRFFLSLVSLLMFVQNRQTRTRTQRGWGSKKQTNRRSRSPHEIKPDFFFPLLNIFFSTLVMYAPTALQMKRPQQKNKKTPNSGISGEAQTG